MPDIISGARHLVERGEAEERYFHHEPLEPIRGESCKTDEEQEGHRPS